MEFHVQAETHLTDMESRILFKLLGQMSVADQEGYGLDKDEIHILSDMYSIMKDEMDRDR